MFNLSWSLKGVTKKQRIVKRKKKTELRRDDLKLSVLMQSGGEGGKKKLQSKVPGQEKLETECFTFFVFFYLRWLFCEHLDKKCLDNFCFRICKRSVLKFVQGIFRTKKSLETKEISFGFVVVFLSLDLFCFSWGF